MPFSPTKLRTIMERRQLTQAALADKAGMKQPNIARLLSPGSRGVRPSADLVQTLARVLQVTMEELME
jgi:transcriptional regulator with XRE-family HTH domain